MKRRQPSGEVLWGVIMETEAYSQALVKGGFPPFAETEVDERDPPASSEIQDVLCFHACFGLDSGFLRWIRHLQLGVIC